MMSNQYTKLKDFSRGGLAMTFVIIIFIIDTFAWVVGLEQWLHVGDLAILSGILIVWISYIKYHKVKDGKE